MHPKNAAMLMMLSCRPVSISGNTSMEALPQMRMIRLNLFSRANKKGIVFQNRIRLIANTAKAEIATGLAVLVSPFCATGAISSHQ